jgi:S-adenosylmethionine:tRNA ribosyltransferase-isomerase
MDRPKLSAYDYQLPPEAIAQHPVEPRDQSRLLLLDRGQARFGHHRFAELPALLRSGDLLIMNDTRVIPARLFGTKRPGGGRTELLLVRDLGAGCWEVMVRAAGRLRPGSEIDLPDGNIARLLRPLEAPCWEVRLPAGAALERLLERHGHVPLPPYIRRDETPMDGDRYQTVFARIPGAVAAPTAGLHFTPDLLARLSAAGIGHAMVTLHVGPGTFRPLDERSLQEGRLHREWYELTPQTAERIRRARETDGTLRPGSGDTHLFIHPPYRPRVVDLLITNFHLPRSSLLMLVACFAGRERVLEAYAEALRAGYRFYSYGDAMLIR